MRKTEDNREDSPQKKAAQVSRGGLLEGARYIIVDASFAFLLLHGAE